MAIDCNSEKGCRILDFLTKELDLPDEIIEFDLCLRVNEPIIVKNLSYHPVEKAE
jgi:hypothetical protein